MSSDGRQIAIGEWLASRTPSPPDNLADRLSELAAGRECKADELPAALVEIATRILGSLDDSRQSALDLLAADALITYAMEAAADSGVEDAPRSAMTVISTGRS